MTLEEIMEKSKDIHDHVTDIDTLPEARKGVVDLTAMIYYLAQAVLALKTAEDKNLPPHVD